MADVNGTINVEVLYREAGSPGSGSGGTSGGGTADGAEAADEKKKKQAMSDSNKFLKGILGSMTVGALIKQSKIGSSFLGTLTQLMGALIDVFLMPFVPLLIPVLKFLAKVVTWFAKFMQDPAMMLKEAFWAAWNAVKDAITGLFSKDAWTGVLDNITSPDWGKIMSPSAWLEGGSWAVDKIVPLLVGGAGIWAMTKVLGFMFGASGALKNGIMSMLGLGGGQRGITDMLANSKCCPGGVGATPIAKPAGRIGSVITKVSGFVTAGITSIASVAGSVITGPLVAAIATTAAAGALAVSTIAAPLILAKKMSDLPEISPKGQFVNTVENIDSIMKEQGIGKELKEFRDFLKHAESSSGMPGLLPAGQQAFKFEQAFSQFGNRGVVNQMRQGAFGEEGIELVLKLDLQQADFETKYNNADDFRTRVQQNFDNQSFAQLEGI